MIYAVSILGEAAPNVNKTGHFCGVFFSTEDGATLLFEAGVVDRKPTFSGTDVLHLWKCLTNSPCVRQNGFI